MSQSQSHKQCFHYWLLLFQKQTELLYKLEDKYIEAFPSVVALHRKTYLSMTDKQRDEYLAIESPNSRSEYMTTLKDQPNTRRSSAEELIYQAALNKHRCAQAKNKSKSGADGANSDEDFLDDANSDEDARSEYSNDEYDLFEEDDE